jgi:hypothetical protein
MKTGSGERRMMADEGSGCIEWQLWMWVGLTHPCSVRVAHDKFLRVGWSSRVFRCA